MTTLLQVIVSHCHRFIVLLFFAVSPLAAQVWPTQYAVTRAQEAWLSYAEIHNVFENVAVAYSVGEFDVRRGATSVARPSLLPRNGVGALYKGSSGQGLDAELARDLRSSAFRYAVGDSLRFHRAVTVRVPCINAGGTSDNDPSEPSTIDQTRMLEDGRLALFYVPFDSAISDTMRVCIALVDAQTHTVLSVLDSIAVGPDGASRIYAPRGTDPLRMNRLVVLPPSHAQRDVYLAALPFRSGPSTHGLGLSFATSHYTRSAIREYTPIAEYTADRSSAYRQIELGYVQALIDHYDRVVAEDGCVRYLETSIMIDDPQLRLEFARRYHDDVSFDAAGVLQYRMRQCGSSPKQSLDRPVVGPAEVSLRGASTSLQREAVIRLHAELVQATLAIYEVGTGKRIVEAPVCRNGQREDVVAFELPASGSYVARLSDVLGQLVTVQFTVLR